MAEEGLVGGKYASTTARRKADKKEGAKDDKKDGRQEDNKTEGKRQSPAPKAPPVMPPHVRRVFLDKCFGGGEREREGDRER